jgi:low affinity Fe/Cu permease
MGTNASLRTVTGQHFRTFARKANTFTASHLAMGLAFLIVIVWALSGTYFHYSNSWQALIGTGTSIVTFLMVFVLNNAQSRDTAAINAKLDAVIIAIEAADNRMIGLEHQTDVEAHAIHDDVLSTADAPFEVTGAEQP